MSQKLGHRYTIARQTDSAHPERDWSRKGAKQRDTQRSGFARTMSMKTFRLLALLPLVSGQILLGQTTSPVVPDSTTGSTSVNFTGANANKGAGEDLSAGGTGIRIPVDPQARQASGTGQTATAAGSPTTGIVTSGMTAVPAATGVTNAQTQTGSSITNTTNVTGTAPGAR